MAKTMEQNKTLGGHSSVLTGWVKREDNVYIQYREGEKQKGNERDEGVWGRGDKQTDTKMQNIYIQ